MSASCARWPPESLPAFCRGSSPSRSIRSSASFCVPARVHPPAESQVIGDREPGVGRGVLGDEADAGELVRRRAGTPTEDGDRPGARLEEADGELEQRGLAGAVRPDEPDDLAGGDGERALRERPLVAVALAEAVRLEDGGHATSSAEEDRRHSLKERLDALLVETRASRLRQPTLQALAERSVGGERVVAERLRDEDADARPCRDEAEVLQLLVRLQHRVRVDREARDHLLHVGSWSPTSRSPSRSAWRTCWTTCW